MSIEGERARGGTGCALLPLCTWNLTQKSLHGLIVHRALFSFAVARAKEEAGRSGFVVEGGFRKRGFVASRVCLC